jgi:hypothetical protein
MSAYVVWACLVYGQVLVRGYRPQIRHNDFRLTTHMSPFSFQGEKALCTQRMCCSRVQVCRDACELAHFMGGGRCHRYTTECNIPGRLHTVGHLTIMFLRDEGIPGQPIGRQIGRRRRTAVPLPQCSFRATVRSCKMYICRLLPTAFVSAYYSYSCPLLSRQAPYSLTIPAIPAIHTIHIIYAQCTLTYRLECLERKQQALSKLQKLKIQGSCHPFLWRLAGGHLQHRPRTQRRRHPNTHLSLAIARRRRFVGEFDHRQLRSRP